MSVVKGLYTGAAIYGRISAVIGSAVMILIALVLAVGGFAKLRDPRTSKAMMTIASVKSCTENRQYKNGQEGGYDCIIDVLYYSDNLPRYVDSVHVYNHPQKLVAGQEIELRYNPSKPDDVAYELAPSTGYPMIGGAVLLTLLAIGWVYVVFEYKGVAAIGGISALLR
jgi:hypothetical protein